MVISGVISRVAVVRAHVSGLISLLMILLMDKILHYPLQGIYHNSHSLESLRSCRILSINSMTTHEPPSKDPCAISPALMLESGPGSGTPNNTWRVGGLSKWVVSKLISTLKGTLTGVMVLISP